MAVEGCVLLVRIYLLIVLLVIKVIFMIILVIANVKMAFMKMESLGVMSVRISA